MQNMFNTLNQSRTNLQENRAENNLTNPNNNSYPSPNQINTNIYYNNNNPSNLPNANNPSSTTFNSNQ